MFRDSGFGREAACTVSLTTLNLDEQLPARVHEHVQPLKLILPVVSVSVLALKRQDAELDDDIAWVLHRHACDPLDLEIEKLEAYWRRSLSGA
jgi:hypothetical protein